MLFHPCAATFYSWGWGCRKFIFVPGSSAASWYQSHEAISASDCFSLLLNLLMFKFPRILWLTGWDWLYWRLMNMLVYRLLKLITLMKLGRWLRCWLCAPTVWWQILSRVVSGLLTLLSPTVIPGTVLSRTSMVFTMVRTSWCSNSTILEGNDKFVATVSPCTKYLPFIACLGRWMGLGLWCGLIAVPIVCPPSPVGLDGD